MSAQRYRPHTLLHHLTQPATPLPQYNLTIYIPLPGEGRDPYPPWIPASTGMTKGLGGLQLD
jgi:hypothetical protein